MHAVGAQQEDEALAGPDTLDDLLVPGFARTQAMPLFFELVQPDSKGRIAPLERGGDSHRDIEAIHGGIADEVMGQSAIIRALKDAEVALRRRFRRAVGKNTVMLEAHRRGATLVTSNARAFDRVQRLS